MSLRRSLHAWWLSVDKKLVLIIALAAVLMLFRLSYVDMTGDDAIYSTRSIGMVDYLFGDEQFQPTPLQWYNPLPWWAHLSWHDHPLVLFIIQNIFLKIHVSLFWAKLPYVFMGLGTIALVYASVKKMFSVPVARMAALLLALNAHFIWLGRVTFMEGGVLFFISLAWYYFIRFLEKPAEWWKFGLALGLMLETKFTTFFIIPTFLTYLLIKKRDFFRQRELYYAAGVALVLFLPIIIYNGALYASRGHLSLQFARLLNESKSPWHLAGTTSENLVQTSKGFLVTFAEFVSFPYFVAAALAIGYCLWRKRKGALLILLGLGFFFVEDRFIGARDLYSIFIAPLLAIMLVDVYVWLSQKPMQKKIIQAVYVLGGVYLLFFVVNSHWLSTPVGRVGWTYAGERSRNFGVKQLDDYLNKLAREDAELTLLDPAGYLKVVDSGLKRYLLRRSNEELAEDVKHAHVILFDSNINWFSRVWLFERRRFYNNLPLVGASEKNLLEQLHLDSFYFVTVTPDGPLDSFQTSAGAETEANLIKAGSVPTLIYRDDGRVAFKVYYVDNEAYAKSLKKS